MRVETCGSRCIGFNTPREHNLTIELSTDKISPTGLTRTLVIRPFKGTEVPANYKIANAYAIRFKRGSCWRERLALPLRMCVRTFHVFAIPRLPWKILIVRPIGSVKKGPRNSDLIEFREKQLRVPDN